MISFPMCMTCAHKHKDTDKITCDAFPNGIPSEILEGAKLHKKPYPGDNGIQYEEA